MKSVSDMTEKEILALTDEQIARMIDLACVDEGVALLPALPDEPTKPDHEPDLMLYKVEGSQVAYPKSEAAVEVVASMVKTTPYILDYVSHGRRNATYSYVAKPMPRSHHYYPKVSSTQVYSESMWDRIKDELDAYNGLKEQYDAAKKEYDSSLNDRKGISADIWGKIEKVRTHESNRNRHRREFQRYLDLADGNRSLALKFYADSHTDFRTDYPELVAEFDFIVLSEAPAAE